MAFLDKQEATGTSISLDCGGQSEADEELAQDDEDKVERETGEESCQRSHILRFTGASFAWRKGGPTVLHNLNLVIPNGELTVIIGRGDKTRTSSILVTRNTCNSGPSGSGKTSLLSAILKEMFQTSGLRELDTVEKYSKYAVLPQHPWLLNASGRMKQQFSVSHLNDVKNIQPSKLSNLFHTVENI